ncbi:M23 family metallopeptidase [Candidatus Bipolaricaulota bacterium]
MRQIVRCYCVGIALLSWFVVSPGLTVIADEVEYMLPFPAGEEYEVTRTTGHKDGLTDESEFAVDFYMPIGRVVVAAADGEVVDVKFDSNEGDDDWELRNKANYVLIEHLDGYRTLYLHLQHNEVFVEKGDQVRRGEPIALSGNTGYSKGPHLHIQLQVVGSGTWWEQSVPISFADVPGNGGVPELHKSYMSGNLRPAPVDEQGNELDCGVEWDVIWVSPPSGYVWLSGDTTSILSVKISYELGADETGYFMAGLVDCDPVMRDEIDLGFKLSPIDSSPTCDCAGIEVSPTGREGQVAINGYVTCGSSFPAGERLCLLVVWNPLGPCPSGEARGYAEYLYEVR